MKLLVRQAVPRDALAPLLYAPSPEVYDLYFGGPARALRALARMAPRPGHTASVEVCLVAGRGGVVDAVLAGFPQREYERRTRRFHSLALRRIPPWRWSGPWRTARIDALIDLEPPPGCFYVDSLAVAHPLRHRGLARALLEHAEARARRAGCRTLALDTEQHNRAARALYESAGMTAQRTVPLPAAAQAAGLSMTAWVAYAKAL